MSRSRCEAAGRRTAALPTGAGTRPRRSGCLHVAVLPLANRTPDDAITQWAIREARIVITKDADFVASFWLHRKPPKLLLVSTVNISNDEIWRLFAANLARLETAFAQHDFVELSRGAITIHV